MGLYCKVGLGGGRGAVVTGGGRGTWKARGSGWRHVLGRRLPACAACVCIWDRYLFIRSIGCQIGGLSGRTVEDGQG